MMSAEHEPVLAPELVSLLAPAAGQTAIDCTFGGGGHARLLASSWAGGTLIGIDRDPPPSALAAFAATAPCRTASSAPTSRQVCTRCARRSAPRHDYMDSECPLDAGRCLGARLLLSYDAPLDMRMDHAQSFDAADLVNEWPESRIAQVLRRFGEERYAGGIAREIVAAPALDHLTTSSPRSRGDAGLGPLRSGHPAKRSFQAIRVAVNGELEALNERCRWPGTRWGSAAASPRSPSTRSRTGGQAVLAEKARGCVCRGAAGLRLRHEPEAELLTRRAVAPGPAEVAANPRSRSAHLRARSRSPRRRRWGRAPDGRRRPRPAARAPRQRHRALAERARRGANRSCSARKPARRAKPGSRVAAAAN